MEPICQQEFDTQQLVVDHPARLHDQNKKIVFEMSSPPGATHSGTISFTRWKQMPLPETITRDRTRPVFELREEFFTYESPPQGQVDWHLNFADCHLFCAYGGPLFAQDEMQVAEHPALASLRHALIDSGIDPLTVEHGVATPVLVMGAERRCAVASDASAADGRPSGLYGNKFSFADEDVIRRATQVLDHPTTSNIIAMQAPACGAGQYTREQIEFVLSTAVTGFRAAVYESQKKVSSNVQTVIHTGYWGCGAYGGNRELMPLLQMIAACCAELDTLVFHSGSDNFGYDSSLDMFEEMVPPDCDVNTDELLSLLESAGYKWGVSDGN